ncbi:acylphosphatase [Vibrio sinaloensis]|uniref:acylphosphatase n=1 Tax=Photobacterium sp. (strain ATCC 43367) TaxID=379097 RepID=UPI00205B85FA|nr:acylphosphatase [Vibrio sinaloensis]UPQ86817.1 acylphosphatase [Vibrio sinaloensis]
MEQSCEKFTVSGVVQGVGFRYHTAHQAMQLGLEGYAMNLANGDVEVVACGQQSKIDRLSTWLEQGSRTSHVDSVVREPISYKPYKGFKIL